MTGSVDAQLGPFEEFSIPGEEGEEEVNVLHITQSKTYILSNGHIHSTNHAQVTRALKSKVAELFLSHYDRPSVNYKLTPGNGPFNNALYYCELFDQSLTAFICSQKAPVKTAQGN